MWGKSSEEETLDGYLKESVSDAKEGMMRIASAEP